MVTAPRQIVEGIPHPRAYPAKPREVLIGIEDNKPQVMLIARRYWLRRPRYFVTCDPNQIPFRRRKTAHQIPRRWKNRFPRRAILRYWRADVKRRYGFCAVKRAVVDAEPITERVVTLTGEAVSRPATSKRPAPCSVICLTMRRVFCPSADQMVIMGGPLMGFTPSPLDVPVVKSPTVSLAPSVTGNGSAPRKSRKAVFALQRLRWTPRPCRPFTAAALLFKAKAAA